MKSLMLKPRPPLPREAAELLSEHIITGKYAANTFLPPERELCQQMGVSRTVVREAIKLLESSGLVRIQRGLGTLVLEPRGESVSRPLKVLLRRKTDMVKHLLETRSILEVAIAALAARRRTEENLEAMERALMAMRERPSEPEGYVDADVAFHAEITRASQNPTLGILLEPLGELLRESRMATFSGPRMVKTRLRQHEEIFAMIRDGNDEGARAAMSRHLSDTQKDLERHQKASSGGRGEDKQKRRRTKER
ncbi:MAG: FadR/GntR family transcriptional regulator [Terriglobia bacterium]